MDPPQADDKQWPTVLWLGPRLNSPFQEDESLAAGTSRYDDDSASGKWPTFAWSKAHRLHDIQSLCDACDRIDITALTEGGPSIRLQDSLAAVARASRKCRFCSLICQSARDVKGSRYEEGFLEMMLSRDCRDYHPVHLQMRDGKLNIIVPHPTYRSNSGVDGWDLGSFRIYCMEGIATISQPPTNPTALERHRALA